MQHSEVVSTCFVSTLTNHLRASPVPNTAPYRGDWFTDGSSRSRFNVSILSNSHLSPHKIPFLFIITNILFTTAADVMVTAVRYYFASKYLGTRRCELFLGWIIEVVFTRHILWTISDFYEIFTGMPEVSYRHCDGLVKSVCALKIQLTL